MTHGIKALSTAAAATFCIVLLAAGGSTAESSDQAKLPGDAGPGPYPQGCVDCHTAEGAGALGAILADLGHKNVDKTTGTVPTDCNECHSEDGGFTPFKELPHLLHYDKPADNAFVGDYGGNCLHCHALDAKTGIMTVKSGPKNW
ncbi:MAG TPA: hypothetical protein VMQ83_13245 [Gammaproteobacteria bacterium]|nr:hypothetical protein [Gammaproteobacteria bacterium]